MKKQAYKIEYCTDDVDQAISNAHLYDQLEYCAALELDGLTPSADDVSKILHAGISNVKVMIRSRPGDFVYTEEDMEVMKAQVATFLSMGVNRFVFGATKLGRLDMEAIQSIAGLLDGKELCIHKAIDLSEDIFGDLTLLLNIENVKEVLSSGGAATAMEGAATLKQMIAIAQNKIDIIAAGKVTKDMLVEVHQKIGAPVYHGRKII